jgi:acetyl-CoA acetyltransferase
VSVDDVLNAPIVSDPLGLLDICATSDGGAALVVSSLEYAQRHGVINPVRVRGISTVTPSYPQTTIELPNFATDSAAGTGAPPEHGFKESIAVRAYEEAGLGPDDLDCAEVYDLSTAMELDWYEQIGLCKQGEAEKLLRDGSTTLGGRVPVNASGGLACFGEAVPAQAIAQVCELTWQVQGRAAGHQVEGAHVGLSINQGLFGHGSAVIVSN